MPGKKKGKGLFHSLPYKPVLKVQEARKIGAGFIDGILSSILKGANSLKKGNGKKRGRRSKNNSKK